MQIELIQIWMFINGYCSQNCVNLKFLIFLQMSDLNVPGNW